MRYGTSAGQLRSILGEISELLVANPDIETATARVRLVEFGAGAIKIELFAYVLTVELLEFLAVREELLLQIAEVVEASGSSFARPDLLEMGTEAGPSLSSP